MNDLNYCSFIGRIGADPEVKQLPSGDSVTNFKLAVGWKGKEKEGVEWISCVCFGKLAEICGQYLLKGKQVFVSGKLKNRMWEKDGQKHYATDIVLDNMQMLGSKESSGNVQSKQQVSPEPANEDIPF